MPAVSEAQRRLFAIAEHKPSELYAKNRNLAKLPKVKLHEFASTPSSSLSEQLKHKAVKLMSLRLKKGTQK